MTSFIMQGISTLRLKTLLVMILLFCVSVLSQTHYRSNIAIGAKGGADASQVLFSPSVNQTLNFGTLFGAMFRYVEEDHFGLIAEVNFTQRGWKEDFQEKPYNYRRTLNYIEVPVLAHIYFGRRGRFFINAGPEIGFYLGQSEKSNFDPYEMETLPDFPIKNRTNSQMTMTPSQKVDYGITGGIGGEFFINPGNSIMLEARFYYGLGNVFPSARKDIFSSSNNMTVSLTAGYFFRIK